MGNGSDDRLHVFLQWKGTDACLDFYCTCGRQWHFDGYFANELTCGHCGQTWKLPHMLTPEAVEPTHPLTLVFDEPVVNPERGAEFTVHWPRPVLDGAKLADVMTVQDEDSRAVYVDLLRAEPAEDGKSLTLTLRTRDPA